MWYPYTERMVMGVNGARWGGRDERMWKYGVAGVEGCRQNR